MRIASPTFRILLVIMMLSFGSIFIQAQENEEALRIKIGEIEHVTVPVGIIDITLYRDDFRKRLKQPLVKATKIPFPRRRCGR